MTPISVEILYYIVYYNIILFVFTHARARDWIETTWYVSINTKKPLTGIREEKEKEEKKEKEKKEKEQKALDNAIEKRTMENERELLIQKKAYFSKRGAEDLFPAADQKKLDELNGKITGACS